MKTKSTLLFFSFLFIAIMAGSQSTGIAETGLPDATQDPWYGDASAIIAKMEYDFYPANNQYRTTNSANGLGFIIQENGFTAFNLKEQNQQKGWEVSFLLTGIGRSEASLLIPNGEFRKEEDLLLHDYDFGRVEYANTNKGMRQNFIIANKPGGAGNLRVEMNLETALFRKLINGNKLVFYGSDNSEAIRLNYDDLNVWDANNKTLNAHMELSQNGNNFSIVVDDKNAVYPITIDPLNTSPEWTTSANGILPGLLNNLSLQVSSLYGYTVTNLGDIDGDTYDDVAVGAPGMADVISGSGALLNVGAVFIYKGSATGFSATPSKVLQPSTAGAGALFGLSIEAGNISADGKNDILVGAPLETYQTTVSGLLGNINVNVKAGKVYYYRSEDMLSSSNPSPFLQLRLQGDNFFSIGILGLLNNTDVNALFGYSIGVTDDLNGDNRQDIIIGCPAYLGKNLLSVQSGAAFVYYSNNLGTISPVQLDVPTPSILGLISLPVANLSGLLFGFSVEGTGDYNNDGHPDVVVGAPAGINLNSLGGIFSGQVLGGSAYVYYGNGSGVNSAIGATLQGSPTGLLSNAANLFGYKIKAIKNAAGVHNGDFLVSAVNGGVISNVVNGLRLKAGQVHLFKKKTVAFASPVNSDQTLSSPRSTSLLSLLSAQNLNVSLLYGASMDNMRDINCDGYSDIIIGEPLSTNVPIIGANVTGGAVYAYYGQANGLYSTSPAWSAYPEVSPLLGVNATALFGFSVAGGIQSYGPSGHYRAVTGGPTNTFDFGSGLLNLGNTMGTLMDFTFDNNGLGKAYSFETNFCSGSLITLPVNLEDFSGEKADESIKLKWSSTDEINLSLYELQRSADGRNFETIAMVFSRNGTNNLYNYIDKKPLDGVNYYRLKMVNNDSKFEYSKVISFQFGKITAGLITIAPNPVKEIIRIKLSGMATGTYSARLFNSGGQLVKVKKINITQTTQVETINREAFMLPGTYWLQVTDSYEKSIRTAKLVIGD